MTNDYRYCGRGSRKMRRHFECARGLGDGSSARMAAAPQSPPTSGGVAVFGAAITLTGIKSWPLYARISSIDRCQIDDRMTPGIGKTSVKPRKMRRNIVRPREAIAGAGSAIMDFIAETIDSGAPEYVVTGVASIERISSGQVRIEKYSRRKDGSNYTLFYEVWDYDEWQRAIPTYVKAAEIIEGTAMPDDPDEKQRQGKH